MNRKSSLFLGLLILMNAALACAASSAASGQDSSLAEAYRIIASKQFVDLTHSFSPLTPVWRGFGPASFSAAADPATGQPYTIEKDHFRAFFYSMVGQYGTHIDPPAHFDPKGLTMDELPLKQMILPLVVFDITPILKRDPNHALTVDDIRAGRRGTAAFPPGRSPRCAPTWTGTGKPILSASSATHSRPGRWKRSSFCTSSGASSRTVTNRWIPTPPRSQSEKWLLQHGHWQIEVMANLDRVPATGALIVVSWPKPKHGLGFPARAFAILP